MESEQPHASIFDFEVARALRARGAEKITLDENPFSLGRYGRDAGAHSQRQPVKSAMPHWCASICPLRGRKAPCAAGWHWICSALARRSQPRRERRRYIVLCGSLLRGLQMQLKLAAQCTATSRAAWHRGRAQNIAVTPHDKVSTVRATNSLVEGRASMAFPAPFSRRSFEPLYGRFDANARFAGSARCPQVATYATANVW